MVWGWASTRPEHGPNSPGLGPTVHPPPRRAGFRPLVNPQRHLSAPLDIVSPQVSPCPLIRLVPLPGRTQDVGDIPEKSIFTQQVMHIIVQVFIKKVGRRLPGILLVIPPPTVGVHPQKPAAPYGFPGPRPGKKKILKISALDNELPRLPWQTLLKGLQGKIGRDRGAHKQVIIVQIFRRPHVLIPPILEPEGKSRHWAMVMIIGVHHIDCPGKQGVSARKTAKTVSEIVWAPNVSPLRN